METVAVPQQDLSMIHGDIISNDSPKHSSTAPGSPELPLQSMTHSELIEAVRKQVEYYFSKENLQSDPYLTSQMDANMSVPISVVMKFSKMKALIMQDENLLREALVNSTVNIIGDRIKANLKTGGRNTIILREIPSDVPEAEIREIFSYNGCKPIASIRPDIEDTWFVLMEDEADAKDTLLQLMLQKRTFRGSSVKARLKSDTVVRSFYSAPPMPPPMAYQPIPYPAPYPPHMQDRYYGGPSMDMGPMNDHHYDPRRDMPMSMRDHRDRDSRRQYPIITPAVPIRSDTLAALKLSPRTDIGGRGDSTRDRERRDEKDREREREPERDLSSADRRGDPPKVRSGDRNNVSSALKSTSRDIGAGKTRSAVPREKRDPAPRQVVEINSANFPPLHGDADATLATAGAIPNPGYKSTFTKFSADEIISVVKSIPFELNGQLPATVDPASHPGIMSTTPNQDLLHRQRSFSIDETRAQLAQGRPLVQQSVSGGTGADYQNMMFGDSERDGMTPAEANDSVRYAPIAAAKPTSWASLVKTAASTQTEIAPKAARLPAPKAAEKQSAATSTSGSASGPAPASNPKANTTTATSTSSESATKPRKKEDAAPVTAPASSATSSAPSAWAGKPTFANILSKQQPESAASATSTPRSAGTQTTPPHGAAFYHRGEKDHAAKEPPPLTAGTVGDRDKKEKRSAW